MKNERLTFFDNIKGLMILFVVIGHFLDGLTPKTDLARSLFAFIYSVHMPMFFMVSGYFHTNKNIAKKVYFYLVMGLATKAIIFALFFVRKYLFGTEANFSFFHEAGTPWFMYAMAAFILVTYLLRTIDVRVLFGIGIIVGCLAGYDSSLGDYLILSRFFVFFPFYLLGIIVKNYVDVGKLRQSGKLKALSAAVIACWLIIAVTLPKYVLPLRKLFTGRNPYWNDAVYQYGFALRLFCYALSVVLCFAYMLAVSDRGSLLTTVGKRSLQIYFLHRPILYAFSLLEMYRFFGTAPWNVLPCVLTATALGLVLSLKVFSYPTDILRKLCFMTSPEKKEVSQ